MAETQIFQGRYRVLRPLGRGAGGETYLAADLKAAERWVALKVLPTGIAAAATQEAFRRECQLLAALQHPHLARLLDFGEESDRLFYVTEYVEGSNLVQASRERDWNAVFALMVQVAWALDYLHRNQVWHRDIKPDNILVGLVYDESAPGRRDRMQVKLIDFGAAVLADVPGLQVARAGTLPYMAPEVLSGARYDHRADLYSLGIVFYELSLGRLPFVKAKGFQEYLRQLTEGEVDLSPLKDSSTPKGVLGVISRLVAHRPEDRPSSALEIVRLLNQWEGEYFPLEPQILGGTYLPEKTAAQAQPSAAPSSLPPADLLERVKELSRAGKKQEAWHLVSGNLESCLKWSDEGLREDFLTQAVHLLAEQGEYQRARQWREAMTISGGRPAEYFLTGAYLAYRQGQLAEAEAILESMPEVLQAGLPPDKKSRWANYWGLVLEGKNQLAEAAERFEAAAGWAETSGRRDHRASFLSNAGALHFKANRWQGAYDCFREALGLARELKNSALLASIQNNLGNLYLYFGRWAEAEAALRESLELAERQGLKPLIAYNLYLLTYVEEGRGNAERVEEYLQRSLAFAEKMGEAQPLLQSLLARAYWEFTQGKLEKARITLRELERHAGGEAFQSYGTEAQFLRAKILLQRGDLEDPAVAEGFLAYRSLVEDRNAPLLLWSLLSDEGDWAKARGRLPEAREKYRQALEVLNRLQQEVPPAYRESFFRDRKKEKLMDSLKSLGGGPDSQPGPASATAPRGDAGQWNQWVEVNRRILLQHRVEPLLREILESALQLTGAERGFVILQEDGELKVKAARNIKPESLAEEEGRFSYTVAKEVMRAGKSQVVLDVPGQEGYGEAESVLALGIRSLMCVPLKTQMGTVGLVYLDNRFRPGAFDAQHIPLLEAFADQASLALEHARLFQENERTIRQLEESKKLIERLNRQLEKDLEQTSETLKATQEGMRRQNEDLALQYTYDNIIGQSTAIKRVLKSLDRVVDSDINVFVFGESGTGKELIAQAIHFNSPRKSKPFIAENCTALPENLLESELFGHVRGAFTGADQNKVGLFTMADGGTLFLDEVGDMPLNLQAKLLRVLQEGTVRPVGSNKYRQVDVRVVSASNKDLKQLVAEKKFRQDLFYRLNVMQLNLPPLRKRSEDIPALAEYFLKKGAEAEGRELLKLPPAILKILMDYSWPGNIRELQNEMRRLVALSPGGRITPDLLSPHLLTGSGAPTSAEAGLNPQVEELERQSIMKALSLHRGNKVKAAQHLKIARRTLYLKMEQYGIDTKYGKSPH